MAFYLPDLAIHTATELARLSGLSAFHSDCDGCFMSLGGVEFAVFCGPSEADVEARLNSEYLWGRHCLLSREAFIPLPVFFAPLTFSHGTQGLRGRVLIY